MRTYVKVGLLLAVVAVGLAASAETGASPGATELVSVDSAGNPGNDNSRSPSISADGRYIAFVSRATNLMPSDSNYFFEDVFVHDRQTGATEVVSVDSAGHQADTWVAWAVISADGRYVAFVSDAPNLVPGDTNDTTDVFVHDRQTGITERVSVDSTGNQGNYDSRSPSISADGRYVAFVSNAENLMSSDSNYFFEDVFVHDRQTGVTEVVSVDSAGRQADTWIAWAVISADGRYVAFASWDDKLVPGDTNGVEDVFVHDRGPAAPPVGTPTPPAGPTRTLVWGPGWHNGAWSGPDGTPPQDAFACAAGKYAAAYRYVDGRLEAFFPDRPDISNMGPLNTYDAFLILITQPVTCLMPMAPASGGSRTLQWGPGWHNQGWSGADGTAPQDAFACAAGNYAAAYRFTEAGLQRYFPDRPDISNMGPLNKYDAFLILVTAPVTCAMAIVPSSTS